ncbi:MULTISPECIES: hypothetical protein [Pacificimonas]|nr:MULTISPECIES: hypothetical protein [Pacificimonas]MBZ6378152.1 hypothetical protein [Pacificimonas aurantium]
MRLLLLAALVAAPGLAACDADGDWSATKEGDRIVAEVMAGTDSWSADDVTVNGVDLYPGSRITNAGFDVSTSGGGGQLSISFESDDDVETVRDYFRSSFAEEGVELLEQGDRITGVTEGENAFSITLSEGEDGGTVGELTAISED